MICSYLLDFHYKFAKYTAARLILFIVEKFPVYRRQVYNELYFEINFEI